MIKPIVLFLAPRAALVACGRSTGTTSASGRRVGGPDLCRGFSASSADAERVRLAVLIGRPVAGQTPGPRGPASSLSGASARTRRAERGRPDQFMPLLRATAPP